MRSQAPPWAKTACLRGSTTAAPPALPCLAELATAVACDAVGIVAAFTRIAAAVASIAWLAAKAAQLGPFPVDFGALGPGPQVGIPQISSRSAARPGTQLEPMTIPPKRSIMELAAHSSSQPELDGVGSQQT